MEAETEVVMEQRETINIVRCNLKDPDGTPLVPDGIYIPQNAGPQQLQQIVNELLHNVTPFSILNFILHKLVLYFIYLFIIIIMIIISIILIDYLYSHFRRRNYRMLSIYQMRSFLYHLKRTCRKTKVNHICFQ